MNPAVGGRSDRYRYALTPAGAGAVTLVVPGLLVAMAAGQLSLIAISVGAALVLVVDGLSARRAISRPVLSASGPTTATVGSAFPLRIDGRTDRRLECVVGVRNAVRPWVPAVLPTSGEISVNATHRGVIERLALQLKTSVPFGLLACTRTTEVQLVAPVHVEPKRVPVTLPPMAVIDPQAYAYRGDEPLGLRPYVDGDSPRDVHWPSVARTGAMVVRDRCTTAAGTELDVVIETLAPDSDLGQMLGRARSALEQLLAAGFHIRLVTIETDPTAAAVDSPAISTTPTGDAALAPARYTVGLLSTVEEIGIRLSRVAVAVGEPGSLAGLIGSSARLVINPEGFRWQSPH